MPRLNKGLLPTSWKFCEVPGVPPPGPTPTSLAARSNMAKAKRINMAAQVNLHTTSRTVVRLSIFVDDLQKCVTPVLAELAARKLDKKVTRLLLFIRAHNETLSIAMRVNDPDCFSLTINN